MKLIIQIPCYNEEKTLPSVIKDLPTKIDGISQIETQIIDDGSSDKTIEVAKELGVNHIINFKKNKGLAAAFAAGAANALKLNADILVNTDGDNQYNGQDIEKLVQPIILGKSDIVIGSRPITNHPEFSLIKKALQRLGSAVLRKLSSTDVADAASGFRAYNRESLLRLNVFTKFSYCMETLIQAGRNNLKVSNVDIRVNPKTRSSRLFKSITQYVWKSLSTICSVYILYRSVAFFNKLAFTCLFIASILSARFLILIFYYDHSKKVFWPSVILSGVLIALSFQFFLTGIIASLLSTNRKLSEEILYRQRKNDKEIL